VTLGGEEAIRACIIRMGDRIKDFHEGTFPVQRKSKASGRKRRGAGRRSSVQ
jgi:hypothetical protein